MAETPETHADMADHIATYDAFIGMTKWTAILVIILLVLMAFFLL